MKDEGSRTAGDPLVPSFLEEKYGEEGERRYVCTREVKSKRKLHRNRPSMFGNVLERE